jgi:hypothetical protein
MWRSLSYFSFSSPSTRTREFDVDTTDDMSSRDVMFTIQSYTRSRSEYVADIHFSRSQYVVDIHFSFLSRPTLYGYSLSALFSFKVSVCKKKEIFRFFREPLKRHPLWTERMGGWSLIPLGVVSPKIIWNRDMKWRSFCLALCSVCCEDSYLFWWLSCDVKVSDLFWLLSWLKKSKILTLVCLNTEHVSIGSFFRGENSYGCWARRDCHRHKTARL